MKIFHRDKYEFTSIVDCPLDGKRYFAFKCIKSNFSPEIVLVDEAKMIYDTMGFVYFEKSDLDEAILDITHSKRSSLLCLKPTGKTAKNLAENESNWYTRRLYSEVETLTLDDCQAIIV